MIRIATILMILFTKVATAEMIAVRGGEHEGFTRLVVDLPQGRDWVLGRTATGYLFGTGAAEDSFDLSAAFDRISRDRLARVVPQENSSQLEFEIACDCHAIAFLWRPDFLVIDIIDGPAPPNVPLGSTAATNAEAITEISEAPLSDSLLPLIFESPVIGSPPMEVGDETSAEPGSVMTSNDDHDVIPQINAVEQSIIEGFASAASQGFLDISLAPDAYQEPSDITESYVEQSTGVTGQGNSDYASMVHTNAAASDLLNTIIAHESRGLAAFELTPGIVNHPGLIAHTSVAPNTEMTGATGQASLTGVDCLDGDLVDMDDWGDDRNFSTQIAERISALTTELDMYPDSAIEDLVRTYLFFGFGREALQSLALDGQNSQERQVLSALASIIDMENEASGLFAEQLGCASPIAMWTALSRGSIDETQQAERSAILLGFQGLPLVLRKHLSGRLAQIFLEFGDSVSAETIMQVAQSEMAETSIQADMTNAAIVLETVGPDAAIDVMNDLASDDIRMTPEGLTELIDLTLSEGDPIAIDLVELAASMYFEYRDTPIAAELARVQAQSLIANNLYLSAIELISDVSTQLSDELRSELLGAAILALTERSSDPAFLDFAFSETPLNGEAVVENAVASRLVALGFADRAVALLTSPAIGEDAQYRRYLQAEIAVHLGKFDAVEPFLIGLNDPQAAVIRAAALRGQGDFAASVSSQNLIPGMVADPVEAWRAGDWLNLENADDPLLRAASDAVQTEAVGLNEAAPLASGRAMLLDAELTRALASQLLERFDLDAELQAPPTN